MAATAVPVVAEEEEDKIMLKNLLKILLIPVIAVALSGCYTVVWMPNQSSSNYPEQSNYYYPQNYYGDYYYYYDSPWWNSIINQNSESISPTTDRSKGTEFIRNRGERGSQPPGGIFTSQPPSRTEPILTPASPATSSTPADNSGKVESSSSSNSNSNSSNRSSNNNRPARNDNGRNSNGRN